MEGGVLVGRLLVMLFLAVLGIGAIKVARSAKHQAVVLLLRWSAYFFFGLIASGAVGILRALAAR